MAKTIKTLLILAPRIQEACDIASGRIEADPDATGKKIRGGHKDLNGKGRGPWWFRMVLRGGWTYISEERLSSGTFLAGDRRQSVDGEVFPGEIIVQHDRGGPVDIAYLAVEPEEDGQTLEEITFRKRRDGMIVFSLPDGGEVIAPNPRSK